MLTLNDARDAIVKARARPVARAGYISITRVPGHEGVVVIDDGVTAALVEVRGRSLQDLLAEAAQADVWSDVRGVIDAD
jgi:hypothetical protein